MKQRVISAIVALAIIIPIFIIGGYAFALGAAIVAALAYYETLNLKESHKTYPNFIKVLGFICVELITLSRFEASFVLYGISFVAIALAALVLTIPTIFDKKGKYTTKEAFHLLGTVTFIGTFFNLLILIFNGNKWLLLFLILIATMTDTFAMIIGCLIGKHKLIPNVSPKKSVEGSVAGTLVATAISTIYYYNIITTKTNIFILLTMIIILSILGQLGDLFFSKIKRENNIKDFSNIMPGHGGILDRLDSLTFIVFGYIIILSILNMFI